MSGEAIATAQHYKGLDAVLKRLPPKIIEIDGDGPREAKADEVEAQLEFPAPTTGLRFCTVGASREEAYRFCGQLGGPWAALGVPGLPRAGTRPCVARARAAPRAAMTRTTASSSCIEKTRTAKTVPPTPTASLNLFLWFFPSQIRFQRLAKSKGWSYREIK